METYRRTDGIDTVSYNIDNETRKSSAEKSETTFEDALALTSFGKYNCRLLILSIYSLLSAIAEVFSVGVIVTSSQCDLDIGVFEKGVISSVPILGVIASAHFWGYLADTRGRLYTLRITIIGTVIGAFLSSFVNHWAFMTFAKFMSSIFACGTNAVIYPLLGETTLHSHRARFLLYVTTGIMFGQGVITTIAFPTLKLNFAYYIPFLGLYYRPWRLLNQIIALLSLIDYFLINHYTLESPKFYFSQGEHDMGLDVLKKMYAVNTGKSEEDYEVKQVILNEESGHVSKKSNFFQSVWNQTVPLFRRKHLKNTLLIFGISIPTYCITPPFSVWLPYIFNSYVGSTMPDISFCQIFLMNSTNNDIGLTDVECDDTIADFTFMGITGFASFITLVSVFSVILIKYIGKKWSYVGMHLVSAALAVVIDFASLGWGVVAFIGMMCNVVCMGITTSYAVELFPTYMRAMAVGVSMMVARGVSFIFFNIIGVQLLTNCSNFLLYLGIFLFAGAVLGCFLPSDKKAVQ